MPQLSALWQAAQLPWADLEKQFTDFQVVADADGKVHAAIGLHIEGSNGRIHSEAFVDFAMTDALRPALWNRLQIVAQNHGLFRLWTQEAAPWWKKDAGFAAPSDDVLQKLPESYGPIRTAWLTLRLKEEGADPARLDKEIQMFKEAEQAAREKMIHRGNVLRITATIIAALLFIFALGVLFYAIKHR